MATQLAHSQRPGPSPLAGRIRSRPTTAADASGNWQQGDLRRAVDDQLSSALGWFSIGLGIAEIVAPRSLGRLIGAGSYATLLPLLGLREIASGVCILTNQRPITGLWSRVVGDGLDLAFLAAAASARGAEPGRLAAAAVAVTGVSALDVLASERVTELPLARRPGPDAPAGVRVRHAITINKSPEELYRAWRQFENLPQWMRHLESVEITGDKTTHWVAKGPAGLHAEWDAETITDLPNQRLAWQSLEGSQIATSGAVEFIPAPANRGTEVRIALTYNPPGGQLGAVVASLFGRSAEQEIAEDCRRFKSIMETGEAPTTHGQPRGRCSA